MKQSWLTYLMIGGLVALLAVLGVFQYRWLKQISESDTEKARARVQEQAQRYAGDFNREVQNAYFNFQTEAEMWRSKDWAVFNDRLDYWRKNAQYPGLIREFYFFESDPNASALKYDDQSRSFQPVGETAEIAAFRARTLDEKRFLPVDNDGTTLFLPIHDTNKRQDARIILRSSHPPGPQVGLTMPKKHGHLAITLDRSVLTEQLLSDLNNRYFGDGEYKAAVRDKAGQTVFGSISGESFDASVPIFGLSPDNFMFFTSRDLVSSLQGERSESLVINSRTENHTFTTDATPKSKQMKIEVTGDPTKQRRSSVYTATVNGEPREPWTLLVQHSSGSLDAFAASTLRRNLGFGFGALFLVAAAVGAIIISSMRARLHAQRQIDFVSSVSHEFRTPLAVIYSAGENLSDGVTKAEEQVSRYGELIKGEGRKLSAMVEQILEFAGANSGKRKFNFTETNVSDIVDSAIAECNPLIEERGFDLETDISTQLPSIRADKNALGQAIQNLIANSVKYSNGDRWIRVSTSNGDGRVRIVVEDRGIGISRSDLKQIFEPFYRAKDVVDAQIHGNGLGLSLVKQIVTAHGGSVKAESEIGKGSKFTIELLQG